ncbi:hypothetical protein PHYC_02074 [Phycisphaerales bacterium]|nr:hypothetical protein PHYC_02074 [Phycisphaerales bacterium]
MEMGIQIHLVSGRGSDDVRVPQGTTVLDVLVGVLAIENPEEVTVRVNRAGASLAQELKAGDTMIVAPAGVRGELGLPSKRQFHRLLRSLHYERFKSGPGDHEIWKSPGHKLSVNFKKGMVDLAVVQRLKEQTGLSMSEVIQRAREC